MVRQSVSVLPRHEVAVPGGKDDESTDSEGTVDKLILKYEAVLLFRALGLMNQLEAKV